MERRLAAILAADVVGYSRLMGGDEEGTLSTLKSHRSFIDAQVAHYCGRVFGSAGDSVIAEFASPVEAVRCAVEIQQEIEDRNTALPEDKRMRFRIGIHLGDVMADGDNLLGDGVNIAARLEALAPPDGICISKSVADLVAGKVDATFANSGSHELKNIATPVEVWTWPPEPAMKPNRDALARSASAISRQGVAAAAALVLAIAIGWLVWPSEPTQAIPDDTPRIAVLAFDDFSTGDDQGYLSDAIAEGLITELARFSTMAVIARSSSFQYRDGGADVSTIREELRVNYVLEGSQQKAGDALRVTAQLIDARTGAHVWTDTYDRKLADLFTVQEEIVRAVAGIVADIVDRRPLPESDINQVSALRFFRESLGPPSTREIVESRFLLGEKALAVDPESEWGYLIMGLAHRHMAVFFSTPEEKPAHLAKAEEFSETAVAIAPKNYFGYWLRARVQGENGDHAAAIETYRQAIALNPSATHMLVGSAEPLLYLGRFEEGLAVIDQALDLDPKHSNWFHWQRAWALWELDRCDEGLASFQRMAMIPRAAHRMVAATHACLGNKDEALAALKVYLDEHPVATLAAEAEKLRKIWPNPPSVERWLQDMAFAGMPD